MSSVRVFLHHGFQQNPNLVVLYRALKRENTSRVVVVNKLADCDIVVCTQCDCEIFEHISKYPEKFILLLDRGSTVNCQGWYKNFADYEEVIAIFRPTIFRDPVPGTVYKTVNRCYHHHLLSGSKETESHTHPRRKKVFCVPWDMSNIVTPSQPKSRLSWTERSYDILFCVTKPSSDPVLSKHQELMRTTVLEVARKHQLTVATDIKLAELPEYLPKTKIVVSPFGKGEVTALDNRAVSEECVLVKPDCRYVCGYPDLMTNQTVTFCDVDLKNLPGVLLDVLADPTEAIQKSKLARSMLVACSRDKYMENFNKTLISVWDQQDDEVDL